MATVSSNIRVFVDFKESVFFAGDDIECTITFRNIDAVKAASNVKRNTSAIPVEDGARRPPRRTLSGLHQEQSVQSLKGSTSDAAGSSRQPVNGAARPPLSVHIPSTTPATTSTLDNNQRPNTGPEHKHKRSVSVISIGSDVSREQFRAAGTPRGTNGRRSSMHGRSGSAQLTSPLGTPMARTLSGDPSQKTFATHSQPATFKRHDSDPLGSNTTSIPTTPHQGTTRRMRLSFSSEKNPALFRFPSVSEADVKSPISPDKGSAPVEVVGSASESRERPSSQTLALRPHSARSDDRPTSSSSRQALGFGRMPLPSIEGTPRSSIDIYSASNHSDDTTTSDYFPHASQNGTTKHFKSPHIGLRPLPVSSPLRNGSPETLMMGFAQVSGSFTLDGSLVSEAPFDVVKRRAVIGGHGGGGVVGVERASKEAGLFGSFGWSSIGESFNGLLGGGQLSSIKEMKGIANARNIPLLSTPKSILFIDLNLAAGDSKSYSYSFTLPRGLPPTHRGRAIRVSYQLVIGTQRPVAGSTQSQPIRYVEIPFRVFGGVNAQGEDLGHDLMSPYVILKDQARTAVIDESRILPASHKQANFGGFEDFHEYVDRLLYGSDNDSAHELLSPSSEAPLPTPTSTATPTTDQHRASTRSLIDQAMRNSTLSANPKQSQTHFTIAQSSVPIATVILSRATLRLGDTLTCLVDFSIARTPCYAVEFTLESTEVVDPSFAIRSVQSIERATRRIWARRTESAVWAKRRVFTAQIPAQATPGFGTTVVGLEWCVRLEMVTGPAERMSATNVDDEDDDTLVEEEGVGEKMLATQDAYDAAATLLEAVGVDERGTTMSAQRRLRCQSFEVMVPIRVLGASVGTDENVSQPEGLAV